jgi:hypothetical protein
MAYDTVHTPPRASLAAKLALAAAIGSFIASFTGHPFVGIIAALVGLALSGVGFLSAASPRVRGGMMSISALVLSLIGLGLAVLFAVGAILI